MAGQATDVFADRHLVVIDDHDQARSRHASIVERFKSHATRQGAIPDQGNHPPRFVIVGHGSDHAECS